MQQTLPRSQPTASTAPMSRSRTVSTSDELGKYSTIPRASNPSGVNEEVARRTQTAKQLSTRSTSPGPTSRKASGTNTDTFTAAMTGIERVMSPTLTPQESFQRGVSTSSMSSVEDLLSSSAVQPTESKQAEVQRKLLELQEKNLVGFGTTTSKPIDPAKPSDVTLSQLSHSKPV